MAFLKSFSYILPTIYYLLFLAGCASEPLSTPVEPGATLSGNLPNLTAVTIPSNLPGIYHSVEKGETLWRICKSYNVDLDEVTQINHIYDSTKVSVGQKIFIPGAKQQITVAPVVSTADNDDFIWPVKGRVICGFGQVSSDVVNKGIDIQPNSSQDVLATRAGKVVFYSQDFGIFGKTIILEHPEGISSVYARNSEVYVKVGDTVAKGAVLARVGSGGKDSRKYLHFEIRKGHIAKNPLFYLP